MSGFDASTVVAAGTEPLLIAAVGLLAVVMVGLVVILWVVRRRLRDHAVREVEALGERLPLSDPPRASQARSRSTRAAVGGGGGLALATSSAMICPTCTTEYHGLTYCTRDARRLVTPEVMLASRSPRGRTRSAGVMCVVCRRAYEAGLRTCPHDAHELVPLAIYNAMRTRRGGTEPAGLIARICPVCGGKFDLNARFCGHDAGELLVIN